MDIINNFLIFSLSASLVSLVVLGIFVIYLLIHLALNLPLDTTYIKVGWLAVGIYLAVSLVGAVFIHVTNPNDIEQMIRSILN